MHRLLLPLLAICLSLSPFLGCESDESRLAAHLERGDAYMEEEAYEEAIIEFRNALQLAPNNGAVHFSLSQSFLKLGAVKEGFWELRETVRLDPSNHEAVIQFSSLSILAGELEEALRGYPRSHAEAAAAEVVIGYTSKASPSWCWLEE